MIPKEVIENVSKTLNLPERTIIEIYGSFWKFIITTIRLINIENIKEELDFLNTRTSFNIPSLGKLGVTLGRWKSLNKKYNEKN